MCDLGTDGVWFYCRCDFPGKIIGQLIGLAVVGCDVFLEPPIAMDTHDLQAGADIVPADPAGIAVTAGNDRIDGYAVADSYIFCLASHFDDFADKFMADDTGIGGKGIFSMEDMDIGATDTGSLHFHQYLIFRNFRYIPFDNGNTARFFNYNCFHDSSSFV